MMDGALFVRTLFGDLFGKVWLLRMKGSSPRKQELLHHQIRPPKRGEGRGNRKGQR